MDSTTVAPLADASLRLRAKERLYVVCQIVGWTFFLLVQVMAFLLFRKHEPSGTVWGYAQTMAEGLLITHCARHWITQWGWKELSWRPLLPRILGMAFAMALAWTLVGWGLYYGLLRNPWPAEYGFVSLVTVSLLNGTVLMSGWLCIYFFYHLFDRYNRLEIERLRLAAAVKEAELRALKSQINPHFIFNSLNSLRGLIEENPARARQAVTQLANLLRYSLQSGQLETVAFDDELRVVNDYLALEQVRHEERLRLRLDIAPGALQCPIPPMLLQTLVENAVKYGIAPRREGGEIGITARHERDRLRLQVTNPGTLSAGSGSTGVGLRNASDRLRLLFGDRATLDLREEPPGRVVAEVVLPLGRAPADWTAANPRAAAVPAAVQP
jgi:hypothetical protein